VVTVADKLGDILIITAFAASLIFLVCYSFWVDWRKSRRGNHLIRFMQVVALAFFVGVLRLFFDNEIFFMFARAVIYLGVNWVLWWRVAILFEEQGFIKISRTKKGAVKHEADEQKKDPEFDDFRPPRIP
jgi:hypothetical protein